jgi:hypothetical protein
LFVFQVLAPRFKNIIQRDGLHHRLRYEGVWLVEFGVLEAVHGWLPKKGIIEKHLQVVVHFRQHL